MPRADLIPIIERLKEAGHVGILLAEWYTWPVPAMVGDPEATLQQLAHFEEGARIILQCHEWADPPEFWAVSTDASRVAIDPAWTPKPGDLIEAASTEDRMHERLRGREILRLPALVPSARLLALEVLCAIADIRFAIETGSPLAVVHPSNRLGWTLSQIFVLFNYGDWLDQSVRIVDGATRGTRQISEQRRIPLRGEVVEMVRLKVERGQTVNAAAEQVELELSRRRPPPERIPKARTIRGWYSAR